jgi:hypothetical protein
MSLSKPRWPLTAALLLTALLLPGLQAAADDRPRESAAPRGVYGLRGDLVRLDPSTLRPLRGRTAPLSSDTWAWSFSADRSRIALVSDSPGPELRFVNLRTMRVLGDARLTSRGSAWATAWVAPRRVLGVVVTPGDDTVVAGVDPGTRRVVWRRELGGSLRVGEPFRGSLVLVLGPSSGVGTSRLVRVSAGGRIRSAPLPGIYSGDEGALDSRPGLAIDRPGGRAFVVQAGGPVAEVDMRTLAVSLHPPLPGRAPDATSAATRDALWLGRGRLAVTGLDGTRPAGLTLVDTRHWSARKVDSRATAVAVAGGTLFATSVLDSARGTVGSGLTGYSLRGRRKFHRYGDEPIGVEPVGQRVLVAGARRVEMLDARTGRVLRRYRRLYAHPIFGDQPFPPTAAG